MTILSRSNGFAWPSPPPDPPKKGVFAVNSRVEFDDPDLGPIRGTVVEIIQRPTSIEQPGLYKIRFDRPIFNKAIFERLPDARLRALNLLERIAEAAQ